MSDHYNVVDCKVCLLEEPGRRPDYDESMRSVGTDSLSVWRLEKPEGKIRVSCPMAHGSGSAMQVRLAGEANINGEFEKNANTYRIRREGTETHL